MNNNLKIFCLSGSKNICKQLKQNKNLDCCDVETIVFADGEILVKPSKSVRGSDVVLIQSTSKPVNDRFMELLIAIDAMKRASAKSIIVVIPYMCYCRQDRKTKPREPITFKLIANMLQSAGATRILTWDIHSQQTQGFFDIPFDSLEASWLLLNEFINKTKMKNFCIVAPDYGSIKRSRDISNMLSLPLVIVDKRRPSPNEVEVTNILGDCENKDCVIIDDMIDTGGTMLASAKILKQKGAKSVSILATHALFNNNAIEKFKQAYEEKIISNIFVTNTIEREEIDFINVVSIDKILIEIIKSFSDTKSWSMSQIINNNAEEIIPKLQCFFDKSKCKN